MWVVRAPGLVYPRSRAIKVAWRACAESVTHTHYGWDACMIWNVWIGPTLQSCLINSSFSLFFASTLTRNQRKEIDSLLLSSHHSPQPSIFSCPNHFSFVAVLPLQVVRSLTHLLTCVYGPAFAEVFVSNLSLDFCFCQFDILSALARRYDFCFCLPYRPQRVNISKWIGHVAPLRFVQSPLATPKFWPARPPVSRLFIPMKCSLVPPATQWYIFAHFADPALPHGRLDSGLPRRFAGSASALASPHKHTDTLPHLICLP